MSRNLCKDQCCGRKIKLADLMGKPLEFRKYHDYRPMPGVKWQCPVCKRVYFISLHTGHEYWGESLKHQFENDYIEYYNGYRQPNNDKGKYAKRIQFMGKEQVTELGWYEFDMSFYETYNDEGEGKDTDQPAYLCQEDDERTRKYL